MLTLPDPTESIQCGELPSLAADWEPPGEGGWLPAELPDEQPWLTFADWIAGVAGVVRSKGTPAAAWLAAEISELAALARSLSAATPAEFDARRAVLDEQMEHELRDQGYAAGLDCLCACHSEHPLF